MCFVCVYIHAHIYTYIYIHPYKFVEIMRRFGTGMIHDDGMYDTTCRSLKECHALKASGFAPVQHNLIGYPLVSCPPSGLASDGLEAAYGYSEE